MKKILSVLFILLLMFAQTTPVMANNNSNNTYVNFTQKFNVNKSTLGDSVALKLKNPVYVLGQEIPAGTIFYGKIDKIRHSRGGFISANATISFNEMVLPSGETIPVKGSVSDIKIKSSGLANFGKGVITTPFTFLELTVGGIWIVLEAVSILGIIFIPATIGTIAHGVSVTTKGVNRKVSVNKNIMIDINAINQRKSEAK
ncbi:MAG: hypothetical protein MJ180_04375 [Candidatus Gastranaerophilales bacterium]|nr:hypothetical protein [Candidatus Gastranaerophilales bacterium]